MLRCLIIASAVALTSCAMLGKYTGDTFYYTDEGGHVWSCREPEPWRGGNCMLDEDWPDGGLSQ